MPKPSSARHGSDDAGSFSETYAEARQKFLAAAAEAGARVVSYGHETETGRAGEELACDVAVLGPVEARAGIVVIAGTHGAEGYCGSAILHGWLSDGVRTLDGADLKVVLVHAPNPWGFSHKCRATENNVDLNRNFLPDAAAFDQPNPAYAALVPFLHAERDDADEHVEARRRCHAFLKDQGAGFEAEAFSGQSTHPDGLFYTGKAPEWGNLVVRRILRDHLSDVRFLGWIDWHTGFGKPGEITCLIPHDKGSEAAAVAQRWWSNRGGAQRHLRIGTIPKFPGLLGKAIPRELPATRVAGAAVEFGTVDGAILFRADRRERWLRFEGHDDARRDAITEDCKNAYCPRDAAWRDMVLGEGPAMIDRMALGVAAWAEDGAAAPAQAGEAAP